MMQENELQKAIDGTPGEKVTLEFMESRIKEEKYDHPTETLTTCVIVLDNGFQVVGTSACADPVNYKQDIGETLARKDAIRQMWPLFGFLLSESLYNRTGHDVVGGQLAPGHTHDLGDSDAGYIGGGASNTANIGKAAAGQTLTDAVGAGTSAGILGNVEGADVPAKAAMNEGENSAVGNMTQREQTEAKAAEDIAKARQ